MNNSIRVSDILHAARQESALNQNYAEHGAMQEVTAFFEAVAQAAYDSRFHWSPYNQSQWAKYCSGDESYGGACAFSLENDGEVPRTKGLGICGPTGRFRDHIWDLTGHVGGARLREAVTQMGRFSLEGIG